MRGVRRWDGRAPRRELVAPCAQDDVLVARLRTALESRLLKPGVDDGLSPGAQAQAHARELSTFASCARLLGVTAAAQPLLPLHRTSSAALCQICLVGATGSVSGSFLLPGLCYYRLCPQPRHPLRRACLALSTCLKKVEEFEVG